MRTPWKGTSTPMSPGAFQHAAGRIGCDVAAIKAVWLTESSGKGFRRDGTLQRRYEPHHFPGTGFNWRQSLKLDFSKREAMFAQAYAKDPEAACRATSWGGHQVMGFNAGDSGFGSALEMVEALAVGEDAHLDAFVTLVITWGLDSALRAHDWLTFATRYNGDGQAPVYARKIEANYRRASGKSSPVVLRIGARGASVKELQRALGLADDGVFGPETERRIREFQESAGLPADGVVGARTWSALKAKTGAKPAAQPTPVDDTADKVKKWGGIAAGVSTIATGIQEFLPAGAFTVLAYGAVALALIAAGAMVLRYVRGRA